MKTNPLLSIIALLMLALSPLAMAITATNDPQSGIPPASVTGTLGEGQVQTYAVNGAQYEVALVFVSDPNFGRLEAKFSINGELSNALAPRESQTLRNGATIMVSSIDGSGRDGKASFILTQAFPPVVTNVNVLNPGEMRTYSLIVGQQETYTINGHAYAITLIFVSTDATAPSAQFLVNGVRTGSIGYNDKYVSGDMTLVLEGAPTTSADAQSAKVDFSLIAGPASGGTPDPVTPGVCLYNNNFYKAGESFRNDCNTCSCTQSGRVVCTMMACPAPVDKTSCVIDGKEYPYGSIITDTRINGCGTVCTCAGGIGQACSVSSCAPTDNGYAKYCSIRQVGYPQQIMDCGDYIAIGQDATGGELLVGTGTTYINKKTGEQIISNPSLGPVNDPGVGKLPANLECKKVFSCPVPNANDVKDTLNVGESKTYTFHGKDIAVSVVSTSWVNKLPSAPQTDATAQKEYAGNTAVVIVDSIRMNVGVGTSYPMPNGGWFVPTAMSGGVGSDYKGGSVSFRLTDNPPIGSTPLPTPAPNTDRDTFYLGKTSVYQFGSEQYKVMMVYGADPTGNTAAPTVRFTVNNELTPDLGVRSQDTRSILVANGKLRLTVLKMWSGAQYIGMDTAAAAQAQAANAPGVVAGSDPSAIGTTNDRDAIKPGMSKNFVLISLVPADSTITNPPIGADPGVTPPSIGPGVVPGQDGTQCASGCLVDNKCLPYGTRVANGESKYCDISGSLTTQKPDASACQNSYECTSNQCLNAECQSLDKQIKEQQGTLNSIVSWLKSVFGFGK